MDQIDESLKTPGYDRLGTIAFMATALMVAKIIAVRGQPIVNAEMIHCVDDAEAMLTELERRCG